jgi:hypothetical protein
MDMECFGCVLICCVGGNEIAAVVNRVKLKPSSWTANCFGTDRHWAANPERVERLLGTEYAASLVGVGDLLNSNGANM